MAFIPANIQPLPKHNTYAGALVGGARQAAQNVGGIIEHAIKPDGEPTCPGMRPRTISQRLSGLTRIPESVSMAFDAHTKSFSDPEGFARTNAAIARFQQGQTAQ